MRTSFITSIVSKHTMTKVMLTPREIYDVASVSTYTAYWVAKYWQYPSELEERPDVEIFAYIMALLWHIFHFGDTTVFSYLWLIGGGCHLAKYSYLAQNNKDGANMAHVGLQMGGQMALLLLFTDLLTGR